MDRLIHGGGFDITDLDFCRIPSFVRKPFAPDDVALVEEMTNKFERFGDAVGSAFERLIIDGSRAQDVLKGLAIDISRLALQQTVTQPIADIISGGLSRVISNFRMPMVPAGGGGGGGTPMMDAPAVVMNIHTPDIASFRRSSGQIMNDALQAANITTGRFASGVS
jgi:hypothetical protein